jgi:hypothetical protein
MESVRRLRGAGRSRHLARLGYRRGESFRGVGGEALRSPVKLEVPGTDHWYVVLDLGCAAGSIRSSVRVLSEV